MTILVHMLVDVPTCSISLIFECLKETGDMALMNCAYAELDNNDQCTSSDPPKARYQRGSSYASDRSIFPMPSTNLSSRSQKQSAVGPAEDAANLMIEKTEAEC